MHDEPKLASTVDFAGIAEAIAGKSLDQQAWVINRLRPAYSTFYPHDAYPAGSYDEISALFALGRAHPVLGEAAAMALSHPSMVHTVGAHLATAPARDLVELRERARAINHQAHERVDDELQLRRDAVAKAFDGTKQARLSPFLRGEKYASVVASTAPATADDLSRAQRLVDRGRAFLGPRILARLDELRRAKAAGESGTVRRLERELITELNDKLTELRGTRRITSDQAVIIASHVSLYGIKDADRGAATRTAIADGLASALHLCNGEAAETLSHITALEPKGRAHVSDTRMETSASPGAIAHEVGHAWERARPDIAAAAKALRDHLALSTRTYPLRDLSLIYNALAHSQTACTSARFLKCSAPRAALKASRISRRCSAI